MTKVYRAPNEEEIVAGKALIGAQIEIYWDGDLVFYPCKIIKYDQRSNKHTVVYDNDESGIEYVEDLSSSVWRIWAGSDEEFNQHAIAKRSLLERSCKSEDINYNENPKGTTEQTTGGKVSYGVMVVEAVVNLSDRHGTTLNAIRKYVQANYELKKQQAASFNALTMKALNKAVAMNELERVKLNTFRLSDAERERRKERERRGMKRDFLFAERNKKTYTSGKSGSSSSGSRRESGLEADHFFLPFYGTAAANNKTLRKELVTMRSKRDKFLSKRIALIKTFLPDKNYFTRKSLLASEKSHKDSEAEQSSDVVAGEIVEEVVDASLMDTTCGTNNSSSSSSGAVTSGVTELVVSSDDTVGLVLSSDVDNNNNNNNNNNNKSATVVSFADLPSQPSSSGCAAAEKEEMRDDDNFDETKLLYSTMDGVKLVEKPSILTADLHDHQVEGISWMVHMFQQGMPMILGDQMGLGKTLQSIGFLAYLHHTMHKKGPHLIVVPLSVLSNWITEIERFCPSFRAVRFHGPKDERTRIKAEELSDLNEFDILVTTYEILVSECNYFRRKYIWTTVIVDEGHRLKNEKSQLSEKLRQVPCLCKVILTGTPLQNNLRELWAMLYYLVPDVFLSSSTLFEAGFDLAKGVIDNVVLRKARQLLSVFMLRRLKENITIKLPSRREVTILVPLTAQQIELYKQLLSDGLDSNMIETVMNSGAADASKLSRAASQQSLQITADGNTSTVATSSGANDNEYRKLMNLLVQLRKICNHTFLLSGGATDAATIAGETEEDSPEVHAALEAEYEEQLVQGSGKLQTLDRMLPLLQADGHRVLLFSQFTSMLDILEEYCERRNYTYVRLDGDTNRVKRRLDCRRFNAPNSNIFIFLISTRAGGLGLNLATADTVILYDSDWNPQVDLQAMERAHRIGQTKPVRVYRLICSGSVEERMIFRAEKKLFLNAMVAETVAEEADDEEGDSSAQQKENETALSIGGTNMSKGELASLIRFGANCVFESNESSGGAVSNAAISDENLADLLERQGRDKPLVAKPSSTDSSETADVSNGFVKGEGTAAVAEEVSIFDRQQASIKDRMDKMEEVDIRQLGTVLYRKKSTSSSATVKSEAAKLDSSLLHMDTKRISKQRVVMVDGRGTGYGGAVPVLADSIEKVPDHTADDSAEAGVPRGRQWTHQCFCTLCGRFDYLPPAQEPVAAPKKRGGKTKVIHPPVLTPSPLIKCAHCPWAFHSECVAHFNVKNTSRGSSSNTTNMFICPHHKCVSCYRATAAAGGLLFRCSGCLTSYCEDCLPEEEIESIGRFKALENSTDYVSKQSYYIKCASCCYIDNGRVKQCGRPSGITGNLPDPTGKGLIDGAAVSRQASVASLASMASDGAADVELDAGDEAAMLKLSEAAAENEQEEEEEEDVVVPVKTQLMRIHLSEILPPPPPSPPALIKKQKLAAKKKERREAELLAAKEAAAAKKKSGRDGKGKVSVETVVSTGSAKNGEKKRSVSAPTEDLPSSKRRRAAAEKEALESEEEEDEEVEGASVRVTVSSLSLSAAMELVSAIPAVKEWAALSSGDSAVDIAMSNIYNKIGKGRYRSGGSFVADVKHVVESLLAKRAAAGLKTAAERTAVQRRSNAVVEFLRAKIEPIIAI